MGAHGGGAAKSASEKKMTRKRQASIERQRSGGEK